MTVKRRTLWIGDEDWALIEARAKERGVNVSELVRRAFAVEERMIARFELSDHSPKLAPGVAPQFTIEAPDSVPFSTRPFTPVPKVPPKR